MTYNEGPRDTLDYWPAEVAFFPGDIPQMLQPSAKVTEATPLESLPLVVKPGLVVEWHGKTYLLEGEGRYCFLEGCGLVRHVIAFERDRTALFRALAQLHIHGYGHTELKHEQRLEAAQKGHLSLTCGEISNFTCALLDDLGFTTRRASLLTLEEWNGYNNGHALFECRTEDGNTWMLVDIDVHRLFKLEGRYLNLYEFHRAVMEDAPYELECLSAIGTIDQTGCAKKGHEYGSTLEPVLVHEQAARAWYRRIAQTPGLLHYDQWLYAANAPADRARVQQYMSKGSDEGQRHVVSNAEWLEIFYGSTGPG